MVGVGWLEDGEEEVEEVEEEWLCCKRSGKRWMRPAKPLLSWWLARFWSTVLCRKNRHTGLAQALLKWPRTLPIAVTEGCATFQTYSIAKKRPDKTGQDWTADTSRLPKLRQQNAKDFSWGSEVVAQGVNLALWAMRATRATASLEMFSPYRFVNCPLALFDSGASHLPPECIAIAQIHAGQNPKH